ncbi:hypothetical protein [Bacillus sp. FJAT-42315]|uniref:hypothetical protein n=1 Tax=Bacillus sp. FJAT-42315 TaxID=2014077 RepID=UPI000BA98761|nr:hypothetical protein [Bacillus sp. FJAT-42315]PAQ15645.1 hypothetical protein CD798_05420 [Bacillaceae bacterium SAOS 7]
MDKQSKGMALLLACLLIIGTGMVLHSWRMIIYSYIFALGLLLTISLGYYIQKNKIFLFIPVACSVLFYSLFLLADRLGLGTPLAGGNSTTYILGVVPTTAVFLYGIASMILVVPLLYAWSHRHQETVKTVEQKQEYHQKQTVKTS